MASTATQEQLSSHVLYPALIDRRCSTLAPVHSMKLADSCGRGGACSRQAPARRPRVDAHGAARGVERDRAEWNHRPDLHSASPLYLVDEAAPAATHPSSSIKGLIRLFQAVREVPVSLSLRQHGKSTNGRPECCAGAGHVCTATAQATVSVALAQTLKCVWHDVARQVMGDGAFVLRRDGECNFFLDKKGCSVAPDTFELTPELEAERRMSTENRLAMIGARMTAPAIACSCRSTPNIMQWPSISMFTSSAEYHCDMTGFPGA